MISAKQIVTSAKQQLRLESSDFDAWLEKLVNEGVRHLDSFQLWKKQVRVIPVVDGAACLPDNFGRLIALRTGSGDDCLKAIYVDMPFISSCGCTPSVESVSSAGIFEIQDGKIVFHNPDQLSDVAEITLAYFGLNSENGLLKIHADYERAVTAYVCWKFALANFEKYPAYVQQSYASEWVAQKKWVRSKEVHDDFRNTRRQVSEWVHALVADKNWEV
jgi:hypothetical protein